MEDTAGDKPSLERRFAGAHRAALPSRPVPELPENFDADLFTYLMPYLDEMVEAIGSDDEMNCTCAYEAAREIVRTLLRRTVEPAAGVTVSAIQQRPARDDDFMIGQPMADSNPPILNGVQP